MNKKVGATVATLGVAATVLLTGTYAWQSLNQEALNEASAVVNPGGRLHDDFDYNNDIKRIYVENFGPIENFGGSINTCDTKWKYAEQPFPWQIY